MNHLREEAVWKRVLAAAEEAPASCDGHKEAGLTSDQVMELLQDEWMDACTYRVLAGRTTRHQRQCLLKLAEEEGRHYRKLEAVYYLMTGSRPCPDRPKAPCVACTNEELRKRYRQEVEGAARYACLADRAGSFAGLFHCLHREEQHHAERILNLLEQYL